MRSTHPEDQPGPRPAWNGLGLGFAALAVVAFVVLFVPPAPAPSPETIPPTSTVGCHETEAICRLLQLLEEHENDPNLTPAERQTLHDAAVEAGAIAADAPVTSQPPATTTTSTTPTTTAPPSTTTTVPRVPRDPDAVTDQILDDLLGNGHGRGHGPPVTIPEVGEGDS